jgi:hypothetical protein
MASVDLRVAGDLEGTAAGRGRGPHHRPAAGGVLGTGEHGWPRGRQQSGGASGLRRRVLLLRHPLHLLVRDGLPAEQVMLRATGTVSDYPGAGARFSQVVVHPTIRSEEPNREQEYRDCAHGPRPLFHWEGAVQRHPLRGGWSLGDSGIPGARGGWLSVSSDEAAREGTMRRQVLGDDAARLQEAGTEGPRRPRRRPRRSAWGRLWRALSGQGGGPRVRFGPAGQLAPVPIPIAPTPTIPLR